MIRLKDGNDLRLLIPENICIFKYLKFRVTADATAVELLKC